MIILVGAGPMAFEYAKVLEDLKVEFAVIGNSEKSCIEFKAKVDAPVYSGGLEKYIRSELLINSSVILCTPTETSFNLTKSICKSNAKQVLLEKPGALLLSEFKELEAQALRYNVEVYIAYNRRYLSTVLEAERIIANDGGVTSFRYEFTEWDSVVEKSRRASNVKERWVLANSSHVIDLAHYLGGNPQENVAFLSGNIDWHKNAAIFSGAGITRSGALFSYLANWNSPGRWGLELSTLSHRLVMTPLEKLQVYSDKMRQESEFYLSDLDTRFKPGLYLQIKDFLSHDKSKLCTLSEQVVMASFYKQLAGYSS